MESPPDIADQLSRLGRGLVQVNLRLGQVLEAAQGGISASEPDTQLLNTLLDLVDATEEALLRRGEGPGARRSFWARLRGGRRSREDLWRGLAMARAAALERLRALGIEPVPTSGAFDPELHCAVETRPAPSRDSQGTIAATHRPGWSRTRGGARVLLRAAQVSVHGEWKG